MLCLSHIIFFYLTPLNCDSYFACIHLICRYDDHGGAGGYDSASEEDNESIFDEAQGAPNAEEEDEDMERREEELRAELNFATCRVEELKRTLQETKSFLGPRLPTRGKDAPPTAKGREVRAAEEVFEEELGGAARLAAGQLGVHVHEEGGVQQLCGKYGSVTFQAIVIVIDY